jgi:hypothetical protein
MVWQISLNNLKRKIVKFILLIGFVYQFYDLNRDYLEFNILIDVRIKELDFEIPSITLCVNDSERIHQKLNHPKVWNKSIVCLIQNSAKRETLDCNVLTHEIYVRHKQIWDMEETNL